MTSAVSLSTSYSILFYSTVCPFLAAQLMVMTLYGTFDDESFTFPICTPQEQDDAAFQYEAFDAYYSDGPQVVKQSFTCSDQSSEETEMAGFPYFQSVQCITGTAGPTVIEYEDDYYEKWGENFQP